MLASLIFPVAVAAGLAFSPCAQAEVAANRVSPRENIKSLLFIRFYLDVLKDIHYPASGIFLLLNG
jgi:hypothetical protein